MGGITVQKSLTSPLMLVALSSPNNQYDATFLTNYAIIKLQDEITRVPGVARVQVFGGQYALRVWVQPDQLAKLGVTAPEIIAALQTPEQRESSRPGWRRPRAEGPAIYLHGPHRRPARDTR